MQRLRVLAGVFCAILCADGQNTLGEIAGTITSQDRVPIAGAMVTLTHIQSGQQRELITNAEGRFIAGSLPLGTFSIRASLANFKTQVRSGLELHVAERLNVDLTLELGDFREEITITEAASLLRTGSAEIGEVISNQRVVNLPLNGRRFPDLMLLSDNIVAEPRGTRGAALGQTGPTVAIAGQRGGHNMYFLDGASVTDQYFNNLTVSPSIDSIQEFNIQKSIYAAEYGGKASATISAATKSGSNEFHGTAYEFFRNSALDARNYFNGPQVPPLRQNQFGATLGGRITKDRTFFFLSGEALRERRALTRTFSLPPAAVRAGDFSGLPVIYDPRATNASRRSPFPGNQIPVQRLDSIAGAFLEKIPFPNLPGNAQNFVTTPRSTNDNTQFTARIDHKLTEKDQIYGRATYSDYTTFRPFGSTDLNETLVPGFGTRITTFTRSAAVNHTHVFNPSVVHDLRFGFLNVSGGQGLENQGNDFSRRAGLAGVTTDPTKMGHPAMSFADAYSSMGDPSSVVSRNNTSYDFFSNTSWNRGAHSMKFGAYLFRLQFNPQDAPNARGSFAFTPRFTSSAPGLGDGNAFADFLLGTPSSALSGIGRGEENGRTTWLHLYAQDDWKAARGLAINFGLRYEINGHMTDTANRLSNIEVNRFVIASDADGRTHADAQALLPLIPVPVVTSQDAGYHRSLLRPSYRRFAPRFGFAWSPGGSDKTVIRGGFGLFFNQWAYSVQTVLMQNLPFYFNKNVITAADTPVPTLFTRDILLSNANGTIGGSGIDQNFRTEYAESWSLSVQRMLAPSWVAEATYFGSKVIGADDSTWNNIPLPGAGPVAPRRPNPLLAGFRMLHWGGFSNYHSLSLKLEKRLAAGLSANVNYTYSKATDVGSSPGPTFSETNYPQDVRNRRAENALSSFDHRHRLALSFTYAIPFGQRDWGRFDWAAKALTGWSIMGIGSYQTGAPFNVNIPNDNANIGAGPSQRPDVLRDPNIANKTPERWFDTTAFAMPVPFAFGNAGRNLVIGDGLTNTDLSLVKRTAIRERTVLELRGEFFNAFNNTNFADAPGRIAFTPSFGRYLAAENPRQIQLAIKLIF